MALQEVLAVKEQDRLILIKEHGLADGNFIISHILGQLLRPAADGKICLVLLHSTIGHYHNCGKRLGYDLLANVKANRVLTLEPVKRILLDDPNDILTKLLVSVKNVKTDTLIFDNLTHLTDLGYSLAHVLDFIAVVNKHCFTNGIRLVVGMHVGDGDDEKITSALEYYSDLTMEMAPLKTGYSFAVSGTLTVKRGKDNVRSFQVKASEDSVRVLRPGEVLGMI